MSLKFFPCYSIWLRYILLGLFPGEKKKTKKKKANVSSPSFDEDKGVRGF